MPPVLAPVQTYAAQIAPSFTPLTLSGSVTVVLLADSWSQDELDTVRSELLTFYPLLRGKPLRVALLQNGSFGVTGPFPTRTQLKATLDEIPPAATASASGSAAAFFDALNLSVEQWGADGSHVLLAGELPPLDPLSSDYAAALLLRTFTKHRLQVSWFSPTGGSDRWLPLFEATGGTIVSGGLNNYLPFLENPAQTFYSVDWTPVTPAEGFVVSHTAISDRAGHTLLQVPDIAVPQGASLPTVGHYADMVSNAADAATLFRQRPVTETNAQRIRQDLLNALRVNLLDPETLLTGADFYEERKEYATASKLRSYLAEARPLDASIQAALGHALLLAGELDDAEAALKRAGELNGMLPQVDEDLARIHSARNENRGANPSLDAAHRAGAAGQAFSVSPAEPVQRGQASPLAIHSSELTPSSEAIHNPEVLSVLRGYTTTNQIARAAEFARVEIPKLAADLEIRVGFATTLDDAQQHNEALSAWRRVLELRPDFEQAHSRIARLLLEAGDATGAEAAADAGLSRGVHSANLYLVKADALEQRGEIYDSRGALQEGAKLAKNAALLSRLAVSEDTFGSSAANAYDQLANSLAASSTDRQRAIERGFAVSLRDGDLQHAGSFAKLLESSGRSEYRGLLGQERPADSGTVIPGGLDALAFAARAPEHVPPDRFFVQYCQTVLHQIGPAMADGKPQYIEEIQQHLQRVSALEAFGKREANRVVITLSLDGPNARRNTEKVLDLLGIKLSFQQQVVELARGEKKAQAKRQETASALAIDDVGMQEALRAGKPYQFEIPDEWAALYPSEKLWRDTFYPSDNSSAAFAIAVLHAPKMASLYVALSFLDRKTVSELLSAVNLKSLYDRYSDLLYLYSSAFAVQATHAAVPGGPSAEPVWARLAGANPAQPGLFFHALLDRDGGKLLAFFFALSQLDRAHQAFFTANASRAEMFYQAFAATPEMRRGVAGIVSDSGFREFLRSVPVDKAGHVKFPGSPAVWQVAGGRSSSDAQTAKLLTQMSKIAAPDMEDEILLRMAQTRYKDSAATHTELDNFLAVSRIDAHRTQPLDAESALLLAQHFNDSSSWYAYFTDLAALQSPDFRAFFSAVVQVQSHSLREADLELGQLHALLEWICLLSRRRVLGDSEAAQLFRNVTERFQSGSDPASYSIAALESVRSILSRCLPEEKAGSSDDRLRTCLLGPEQSANRKPAEYKQVLEELKLPSLDALFSIYSAVTPSSAGTSSAMDVQAIEKAVRSLPTVELAKDLKLFAREKAYIQRYDTAPLLKLAAQLNPGTDKRRGAGGEKEKLSRELLAALEPQITLALSGAVYAYFLRPTDLVASADPLLVRKHQYFDFVTEGHVRTNLSSEFHTNHDGAGSYFAGGFAQFAIAAGKAATIGRSTGGPGTSESVATEIAGIRATPWDRLNESDQRLVSLRILAAREWVFESARRPDLLEALSEETTGLLSLNRRADLLNGIESRDWPKVWKATTLPDLFALGGRYLARFPQDPWTSPVTAALRAVSATNDGARLQVLGSIPYHTFGCGHPHLMTDAPYEEYERQLLPDEIAERSAEFKLFLVTLADSAGVPPSALADVAEPLALKAFLGAQMANLNDWRSLLAAYAAVTAEDLKQALIP